MEHEGNESWKERLSRIVREVWIPDAERNGHSALHRRNFYSAGLVPVETVTSWDQYKKIVRDRFSGGKWIFRGHSNSEWRLETSLERAVLRHIDQGPNQPPRESYIVSHPNELEQMLLDKAKQLAWSHKGARPADDEILEWLSLLQHHGAPTRLLDWTRSPEIAVFFALSDRSALAADSAVWVIDSEWLRRKAVEQHNLNLSRTHSLNSILMSKENLRLIVCPAIVNNPRMEVQQGLFLCDLSNEETFDITLLKMIVSSVVPPVLPCEPVVWKIVIKTPDTTSFLHHLDEIKISKASLFPGHDFAGPLHVEIRRAVNELIEYVGWTIAE